MKNPKPAIDKDYLGAAEWLNPAAGTAIDKYTPVVAYGRSGGVPLMQPAEAQFDNWPWGELMYAAHDIPAGRTGIVVPWIMATGLDTSGQSAQDKVYLASGGGPTYTRTGIVIGVVLTSSATEGAILYGPPYPSTEIELQTLDTADFSASGDVDLSGADSLTLPGVSVIGLTRVVSAEVAFDDTSPVAVFTKPAAEVWAVHAAWVTVTELFDGTAPDLDFGPTGTAAGYIDGSGVANFPDTAISAGLNADEQGTLLYDGHPIIDVQDGAELEFIATITPDGSQQGAATVYMMYTRLA